MQSIDPKLQNAVWNRVMSANPEAAPAAAGTPEFPISAPELLDMMQDEKNDSAAYRYLSCKACGCDAKTLRSISEEEACHFKKLHAMYFLVTGKCICMQAEKPDCTACLTEALRTHYSGELKGAAVYEDAAKRWPDMADEFRSMAGDETCHSKQMRAMICHRL